MWLLSESQQIVHIPALCVRFTELFYLCLLRCSVAVMLLDQRW